MKPKHYLLTLALLFIGANGLLVVAGNDQSSSESPAVIAAGAPSIYPPIARTARAQGAVTVEVRIDERGEVLSARMISGHPLLKKVSEEAAQQWRFSSIEGSTKQRVVSLVFVYNEVDKGPNPKNEFTTIFMPPYKIEIQAHPKVIE